jgi:hypothetical protein
VALSAAGDPAGSPLTIGHADDAAAIAALLATSGLAWDRVGVVADGPDPGVATLVSADPDALAGNYPRGCPVVLRRQIGDVICRASRNWRVEPRELRNLRAGADP